MSGFFNEKLQEYFLNPFLYKVENNILQKHDYFTKMFTLLRERMHKTVLLSFFFKPQLLLNNNYYIGGRPIIECVNYYNNNIRTRGFELELLRRLDKLRL